MRVSKDALVVVFVREAKGEASNCCCLRDQRYKLTCSPHVVSERFPTYFEIIIEMCASALCGEGSVNLHLGRFDLVDLPLKWMLRRRRSRDRNSG